MLERFKVVCISCKALLQLLCLTSAFGKRLSHIVTVHAYDGPKDKISISQDRYCVASRGKMIATNVCMLCTSVV